MDKTTFLEKVTEALECEDDLSIDQTLEDVPEWDSLGILLMVDMFEELGVPVDLQKLGEIETVKELVELANVDPNA